VSAAGQPTLKLQAVDEIRAAGEHAQVCHGLDHALTGLERWRLLRGRAGE